jgi:hypothetical protein
MAIIYFAIKDGKVVHHTDMREMNRLGLVPLDSMTENDFTGFGNQVRIIDGELFYGKTKKEKLDEQNKSRIDEIDRALSNIDLKSGCRPVRASMIAIKGQLPISAKDDVDRLEQFEQQAQALREERRQLVESTEVPY